MITAVVLGVWCVSGIGGFVLCRPLMGVNDRRELVRFLVFCLLCGPFLWLGVFLDEWWVLLAKRSNPKRRGFDLEPGERLTYGPGRKPEKDRP